MLAFYPIVSTLSAGSGALSLTLRWPPDLWASLFAYSLFIGIGSGLLLFKGLQSVPASSAGVILLLEPVMGTFQAALFFVQPITENILAGGALILVASYLVVIHPSPAHIPSKDAANAPRKRYGAR